MFIIHSDKNNKPTIVVSKMYTAGFGMNLSGEIFHHRFPFESVPLHIGPNVRNALAGESHL